MSRYLTLHRCARALPMALALTALSQGAAPPTERMQQIIQNYVDNKTFMGAVLVADQDKVLLRQAYGYANLDWAIANTPATKYRIGSITKQFTAASILLLKERGKVKLEETVKTYLPFAPKAWEQVTVSHLLTHTSGIPNFTGVPGWDGYKRQNHTPQESMNLILEKPLEFEPGAKFQYSNSNYILLGLIIEKVSGMQYEDFLRQNILTPLNMTETGVDRTTSILPQRAQGYDSVPDGIPHADYASLTLPYSAGFLYSTVDDLVKWERALFGGKVLSESSFKMMTTANLGEYGMGVFIKDTAHHGVITHNGSIEGFDASLNFYPEKQLTIVVLGNVKTNAPDKIAEQLGKVEYGEKVVVNSDRKLVPVARSVLATYTGHYRASPFSTTIGLDGDRLTATAPNGRKYYLFPESQTKFFLKEIDVQIEFMPDPVTKRVTEFLMTQDGTPKRVARD